MGRRKKLPAKKSHKHFSKVMGMPTVDQHQQREHERQAYAKRQAKIERQLTQMKVKDIRAYVEKLSDVTLFDVTDAQVEAIIEAVLTRRYMITGYESLKHVTSIIKDGKEYTYELVEVPMEQPI